MEPQVHGVAMRDGVLLATDVYGAVDTPRPVVLERTPYGRRRARVSDQDRAGEPVPDPDENAARLVAAGYVVVRQDCRGRFDSEGVFVKYFNEGEDGADTVAWLVEQPWCDGRVLMTGVSYSAHAQTAAAPLTPRGLAGLFMDSGGLACAYDAGMRMGGAFELKQVTWALRHARTRRAGRPDDEPVVEPDRVRDWFRIFPWARGESPLRWSPEYEDYLYDQWAHDRFGPFWEHPAIHARGSYERFPDVPTFHVGSWYDPYVRSTIENFTALTAAHRSVSHLLMGPWTHGARTATHAGDVDFGPDAAFDTGLGCGYLEFRRRWFDAVTAQPEQPSGGDETSTLPPPVTYFVMGGGTGRRTAEGRLDHGGRWHTATQWPPAGCTPTTLDLTADNALAWPGSSTAMGRITFDFDPRDPVPTIGGQVTSGEPVMSGGAFDQRTDERSLTTSGASLPLSARHDVVSFRTPVLEHDVDVVGPVSAEVTVSTSAPDTDLTIKLVDEYPPSADYPEGFAMNITDGILRLRFHEGFDRPRLLEPGRRYTVRVIAPDTANRFAAGHRIRLDVSSSNFPRFDVNPNTGAPAGPTRTSQVARTTLHLGDGASRLMISLLDAGSVTGADGGVTG
ncbi:CocE/NonD family hydrolase [Nocardioides acrostichi]|uniref:CocE/NonD family hydrolase n=1 Tax=Nocardioides acrostichi TaxID=2784339 RepID=A0A930YEF8_9ACTN|nr:CocE/NonD family hydrolase [Nocardioides acrostichi]MBF4163449.1 CocE/NonD family hydrolase [Nocardioides acrostichi]